MKNFPAVTAVIPVHNRLDLLARLVTTIEAQTVPFARVVIVDNASGGDFGAFRADVVSMGENAGFARAVNRGWRAAETPWVAILNNDVELDPEWLERLLEHSEGAGFATGLIFDATHSERIDGTYDLMSRGGCAWRAGYGAAAATSEEPRGIAIAPATACLYRRDILERLGGFDEGFESYLEDVDLGLRCVEQGIRGVYVPAAVCRHHGSATLGRWNPRIVRLTARNQLRLVARHYDHALFRASLWQIIVGQTLWGLVAARHGAGFAWLSGKWAGMRGFHPAGSSSPALAAFLNDSEREIRRRATGPYWRWYFRLTGSM